MFEWFRFAIFAVFALFIGIIDFRTKRIPTMLLALEGAGLLGVDAWLDSRTIGYRLLAALGAYGLFYTVYKLRGGLGYGDVQYAGVIGYYLGPWRVVNGLLCAVLLGLGCWCLGHLLFRWNRERRFAFGPWLGCGALAADLIYRVSP